MKKRSPLLLIPFLLMVLATTHAQNKASAIDSLVIELWPDYDKPSVLVLLTGTLPLDTQFPATVTLPMPETAQLNAVARIDGKDGMMKDDILSSPGPSDTVRFITPDLRFRLEYYLPYTASNNQRSFDYTWMADLPVHKLQLKVQQPASALLFHTEPATENVVAREDGFDYHIFPTRDVPAGESFSVHVGYKMAAAQLSVESLPSRNTGSQTPGLPTPPSGGTGLIWPVVVIAIGCLIIIIALVWLIAARRHLSGTHKPPETPVTKQSRVRFCRNCGEPVNEGDNFCGGCGSNL